MYAKLLRPLSRLRHGLTFGAQGVLIDPEDRVLLVRHSYRPGWFFPGGGVEWGETFEQALARELEEEVGAILLSPAKLHGVYANFGSFPGDHIVLFVARHWRRDALQKTGEIAEARLCARHDLPENTDPGTQERLKEIFDQALKPALW